MCCYQDLSSSRIGASPPRLPSPTLHLLFKDYHSDQKFSITTYSPDGIVITSSGTKKGDLFFADVNTQWKHRNVTTDIKVDADSNLFTTITFDEPALGLKSIFSFSSRSKVRKGTNILAIGTDVSYDTKSGDLTKLNAGLCFTKADFIASLTVSVAANILLENGKSLLNFQRQIMNERRTRGTTKTPSRSGYLDENDGICSVCQYGGELILCDNCPSSFHQSCIGLEDIPEGDWFCPASCCGICHQSKPEGSDDDTLWFRYETIFRLDIEAGVHYKTFCGFTKNCGIGK
ncbi:hypothetical protein K1719_001899 [Acacia pycnantha]|nr:hypothetical protein K1719_001899 [Acacia pycnantha]